MRPHVSDVERVRRRIHLTSVDRVTRTLEGSPVGALARATPCPGVDYGGGVNTTSGASSTSRTTRRSAEAVYGFARNFTWSCMIPQNSF